MTLALALPLVAALSACSTFSDTDNVARVGDTALTNDDFQATLTGLGATGDEVLNAGAVREQITRWIQDQLVDPEQVAALYDAGVESGNILCINAIVVQDEATATSVEGQLADGGDFAGIFAAANLDQQLASTNGALPCITPDQITQSADVEFVQVAATTTAENPLATAPLVGTDGSEVAWVVISFRPYAELSVEDADLVAGAVDVSEQAVDTDIFVDPRYGTFDQRTGQVVGLG